MKWTSAIRFDAAFDAVAVDGRRLALARLAVAVAIAMPFWVLIGPRITLTWLIAAMAGEAALRVLTHRHALGLPIRRRDRIGYVAGFMTNNLAWIYLSVACWLQPNMSMAFFAMVLWASLVINAMSFAFRSLMAMLLQGGPVVVVMLLTPLIAPQAHGPYQTLILLSLMIFVLYTLLCAARNVRAAGQIAQVQTALAQEREGALAASQAKSDFLAVMSHELRTPMNGVLGMAHALQMTHLDPRQADYVRTLLRSGDGLMTILDDVLDLSKIEAGRFETEVAAFDLHELLLGVRDLWAARASEKGLTFTLEIDPATPRFVGGDQARVRQILLNLLSNAIKFTAQGQVALVVTLSQTSGQVIFVVADTGPGVDPAVQGQLFQGFSQADATIARRFGGTGLGLAISRNLARLMGGEIALDSQLGEGATFTLTLPLRPMLPTESKLAHEMADQATPLRVLAVDDNPTNLMVARALLESLGCTVFCAGGGAVALQIAQSEPLDLILLDIQMPEMDGYETLRRLRALHPPISGTLISALTANAMAGERERLLEAGFDDYLSKPLNPAALVRVIGGVAEAMAA